MMCWAFESFAIGRIAEIDGCGRLGQLGPVTDSDIVGPSIVTEDLFQYTNLGPTTGSTIRKLADLKPKVLAAMHGTSYSGDGAAALRAWLFTTTRVCERLHPNRG
jgi:hypothetical protein